MTTTTIHTRQLKQYIQDNYNNTHKTSTTIYTRQLQEYTQDNYNNTYGQPTTITRHFKTIIMVYVYFMSGTWMI